jgi:hypothetical protein
MKNKCITFSCHLLFSLFTINDAKIYSASFGFPELKKRENTQTNKDLFLKSLERLNILNDESMERSSLLNQMIQSKQEVERIGVRTISPSLQEETTVPSQSLMNPGRLSSFSNVATGTWKVIYAPHMTTISGIFGGKFDVSYILYNDLTMESHAR